MAQIAPDSVDVTDLQFKLQSKAKLFNSHDGADLNCHNLLATASVHGLVFSGSTDSDLRVIRLKTLEESNQGTPVPTRIVPLPSKAHQIAVNCDHSLLAVDVTKNGICFIQIYSVPSFYANDVAVTHEFQIQGSCHSSSLLWNPVLNNVLAVVTEKGGLVMYTLKSPGLELCSLDGQQLIQSACWSPKGKQIVAGLPNGNLMQYKPDLKPARPIPCPQNLLEGNAFDTIAIQWLATYQFAAVFQSKAEDTTPSLFIVNAPKTGSPTYINYDDICYSQSGPRKSQVFLSHILPWNLLIVASANSMEVGILGTTEQGDFPTWKQFVPSDNARAELPLTAKKQETFPLGMALELGVTHQITIGETKYPVMPMIHLLSTDGLLISFNLLNTMPNTPGICSPPHPLQNESGLVYFKIPEMTEGSPVPITQKPVIQQANKADISFALGQGNATSTPAKSLFGIGNNEPTKAAGTNLFGTPSVSKPPPPVFGSTTTSSGFGSFSGLGMSQNAAPVFGGTEKSSPAPSFSSLGQTGAGTKPSFGFGGPQTSIPASNTSSFGQKLGSSSTNENNTPLITVPPTYTAATKPSQVIKTSMAQNTQSNMPSSSTDQTEEVRIVHGMIREEIDNFQRDLQDLISRSKTIHTNIGTKEESDSMAKQLNELSKLNKEATESNASLTSDVHLLRHNLNETYAMVTEAKNKHKLYTTQNHLQMQDQYSMTQTSKRTLARLESMLKMNESQLYMIQIQIDAQWAEYQDIQKQKKKNTMRIPSLEGVYQTISKLRDILAKHQTTINRLKAKMGMRETVKALEITKSDPVESLTDSILSMSIIDQVQSESEKLNSRKLELLREYLKRHQIQIVKPNRPTRPGIESDVIQERWKHMKKKMSDNAKKAPVVQTTVQQKPFMPPLTQMTSKINEPLLPKPELKFEMPKNVSTKSSVTSFAAPTPSMVMSKPIAQKPAVSTTEGTNKGFPFGSAGASPQTDPPKFAFAQLTTQTAAPFSTLSKATGIPSTTTPFTTSAQKLGGNEKITTADLPKSSFGTSSETTGFSFGGGSNLTTPTGDVKSESSSLLFGTTSITPVGKPTIASSPPVVVTEEKPKEDTKSTSGFNFGGSGNLFGTVSSTMPSTTSFFSGFGVKSQQEKGSEEKTSDSPKSPLASLTETVNKTFPVAPATTPVSQVEKPGLFSLSKDVSSGNLDREKTPEKNQTIIKPTATFSFGFNASGSQNETISTPSGSQVSVLNDTIETTPGTNTPSTDTKSPNEFSFAAASKSVEKTPDVENKSPSTAFGFASPISPLTTSPSIATKQGSGSLFDSITPLNASKPPATQPTSGLFGSSGTGLFGTSNTQASVSSTNTTTTTTNTVTSPSNTGPTEGLFSSFNICSPSSTASNNSNTQNASSIFGANTTFGSAASPPVTSSIFGGGNTNTSTNTSASIFGSPSQPTQPTNAASPFGTSSISKPDQNVFGSAVVPSNTGIFGQANNTFGATPQNSSIFGGNTAAAAAANPPPNNSPFGGASSSIFGANTNQTQSSPFGQPQQTSAFSQGGSLFGGSATFGSPGGATTTGTGAFGTFGQTQAQQPVFGGGATFGSPPAFGSAFSKPSFGGAPTFGSKPLFGSPTQPQAQTTVPTNNLFEQLGSQSSGMTFGNLAQSSPPQQQQQQQTQPSSTFGGSAFSSWR